MKVFALTFLTISFAISATAPKKFFTVITLSGLNLREAPNIKSKIVKVLKAGDYGVVVDSVSLESIEIQGRKGYWLKVLSDGRGGYLFSGFVVLSDRPESVKNEDKAYYEPKVLEEEEYAAIEPDEVSKVLKNPIVKHFEFPTHTVLFYTDKGAKDKGDDPGCIGKAAYRKILIYNKVKKRYYNIDGVFASDESIKNPLKNMLAYSMTLCSCCCGGSSSQALLFGENKALRISYYPQKRLPACGADGWESGYEWRLDPTGSQIIVRISIPYCSFTSENSDIDYKRPEIKEIVYMIIASDGRDYAGKVISSETPKFKELESFWKLSR